MKKIFDILVIITLYFSFAIIADSQIEPIEILEPVIPNLEPSTGWGEPQILWLKCDDQNLKCNFISVYGDNMSDFGNSILHKIDWSVLIQYSFQDMSFNDPVTLFETGTSGSMYWNQANGLIHDASSVTISEQRIFLENAYMQRKLWESDFDVEYEYLISAYIFLNQKYIVGITHYTVDQDLIYHSYMDTVRVWEAKSGKEIASLKHIIGLGYHEIYDSPKGKYVMARSFPWYGESIVLDKKSNKFICAPQSLLYDLSNLRMLNAKRDVTFTQDDKYFVTERDGVPTLVLAQTDGNLLRYSIPSPMISATFSPDGQRLYIAGANSKVYVYESGIDSYVSEWELMK